MKPHAWRLLLVMPLLLPTVDVPMSMEPTSGASAGPTDLVRAVAARLPHVPIATVARILEGVPADVAPAEAARAVLEALSDNPIAPRPLAMDALAGADEAETVAATWDFETSDGGWTHGGNGDEWARGTPSTGPGRNHYRQETDGAEWIEAADGGVSSTVTGDDATGTLALPFPFPWFGTPVQQVHYSTNGLLTFDVPSSAAANLCIGRTEAPNGFAAVLWDDLEIIPGALPTEGGRIWVRFGDVGGAPYAVIQWTNARPKGAPTESVTFQAVLRGDGTIRFQYLTAVPPGAADATVGIEGAPGTDGTEVVCDRADRLATATAHDLVWTVPPTPAHSGQRLFGTDLVGDYGGPSSYWLRSPALDLHGTDEATLSFWHWHRFETRRDGGLLQVTTDGGTSWIDLAPEGGYPDPCGAPLSNRMCVTGHAGWARVVVDLTAFVERDVQIRLLVGTDGTRHYAGWYVDDVELRVSPPRERDAKVVNLDVDAQALLLEDQTTRVEILNRGSATLEDVAVEWEILFLDAVAASGTEVVGTLDAAANATVAFGWRPLATRPHTVVARVVAPLDENPLNDQREAAVDVLHLHYATSFEDVPDWTPSGNASDEWEWGLPVAGPGAAADGLRVWATNLTGRYAHSSRSELTSPPIDIPLAFESAEFQLRLWIQTQANIDGGRVEVRTSDGGWRTVTPLATSAPYTTPFCFGEQPPFPCWATGAAAARTWRTARFDLGPYIGQTIQLRVLFISDASVDGVGLYIDAPRILGRAVVRDASALAITAPSGLVGPDELVTVTARFANSGLLPIPDVPAEIRLGDLDSVAFALGTLAPNQVVERNATFRVPDVEEALVGVDARIVLPGDDRPDNNAVDRIVLARSIRDVRVVPLLSSFYGPDVDVPVPLRVRLENVGTRTPPPLLLRALASAPNGSAALDRTWDVPALVPGANVTVDHAWNPPHAGRYALGFSAEWDDDVRPSDNIADRVYFHATAPRLFAEDFETGGPGWTMEAQEEVVPPDWQRGSASSIGPGSPLYVAEALANEWVFADLLGTKLPLAGDDASTTYALPSDFFFPLYGTLLATHLGVSTNGFLTAMTGEGNSPTAPSNTCAMPSFAAPNAVIAPFWDDLVVPTGNAAGPSAGGVFAYVQGTAPNRTAVVEWKDVQRRGSTTQITFEVLLHESGWIRFQYLTPVPSTSTATTGVERADGEAGTRIACNDAGAYDAGFGWRLSLDPGPPPATSPPNVWGTNLAGLHGHSRHKLLATRPFDADPEDAPVLRFNHFFDTQAGRDGGRVVTSTDGGASWAPLIPVGGYTGTVAALGGPGWTGDGAEWTAVEVALAAVAGPGVRLAFEFASDGDVAGPGWYVDDVRVENSTGILLMDDFDGPSSVLAPVHDTDWAIGVPTGVVPAPAGAAAATGLADGHRPNLRQNLTSPPFDGTPSLQPVLSLRWFVDTEAGDDLASIYMRPGPDEPWTLLLGPLSGRLGWRYEQFTLGPGLIGPAMQVRIELSSNGLTEFRGLIVDEVSLSDLRPAWDPPPPPTTVRDEQTFTTTLRVRNDGPYPDRFMFEASNPTNPSWVATVEPSTVALAPGERQNVTLTVVTGPGGTPGSNPVVVHAISQADPFRRALVTVATLLAPVPRPDLRVQTVATEGTEERDGTRRAVEGDPVTIRVHVLNEGAATAQDFPVHLIDRGPDGVDRAVGMRILPATPPRAGSESGLRRVEFGWIPESAGGHVLFVRIDPDRARRESDRTDNEASLLVDVVGSLRPDLSVEAVSVDPTLPRVGEPSSIWLRLSNQGEVAAGTGIDYEVLLDHEDGRLTTPPLPSGPGPHVFEARVRYDLEAGVDAVTAEALFDDDWTQLPMPVAIAGRATLAEGSVLTGRGGEAWANLSWAFDGALPTQIRFTARVDATNAAPARGWYIDALRWSNATNVTSWAEDFEGVSSDVEVDGFLAIADSPRAPIGFISTGSGFMAGGQRAAGFGRFDDAAGYDDLMAPQTDGSCPAGCALALGLTEDLVPGETREVSLRWTPASAGEHRILARVDPKGTVREGPSRELNQAATGVLVLAEGLRFELPAPPFRIAAGGTARIQGNISNDGHQSARVEFGVDAPAGWNVTTPNTTTAFDVAPGGRHALELRVRAPASAAGASAILLRAHEVGRASNHAHATLPFDIIPDVGGAGSWNLTSMGFGNVTHGQGLARLRLTTRPGASAELALGISSRPPGWFVEIDPSFVRLGANESRDVLLRIRAPASEPTGVRSVVVWANDGTTERNTTVLIALRGIEALALELPEMLAPENGTARGTFIVRNLGASPLNVSMNGRLGPAIVSLIPHTLRLGRGSSSPVAFTAAVTELTSASLRIEARDDHRVLATEERTVGLRPSAPAAAPVVVATLYGTGLRVRVHNPGGVALEDVLVRVEGEDGMLLERFRIDRLEPGANRTLEARTGGGSVTVRAIAGTRETSTTVEEPAQALAKPARGVPSLGWPLSALPLLLWMVSMRYGIIRRNRRL